MEGRREQGQGPGVGLRDGEVVVDWWRANHTRARVAVGGRLWLTDQRLVFEPHGFEAGVIGRRVWTCELTDVLHVGTAPRGWSPTSGAWRRRLAVQHGATTDLFVVNRVGKVVEAIQHAQMWRGSPRPR